MSKMTTNATFAVDFDGTCVAYAWPDVGQEIGAAPVLKALVEAGHKIVLWTMRDDQPRQGKDTTSLGDAVAWFAKHGIPLYGVNKNPRQKSWNQSPKAYAHVYIDDAALGCPVRPMPDNRPAVDWAAVEKLLVDAGYLLAQLTNPMNHANTPPAGTQDLLDAIAASKALGSRRHTVLRSLSPEIETFLTDQGYTVTHDPLFREGSHTTHTATTPPARTLA